ncbi:MAG: hypothetical protein KC476_05200, partial [Cyanobacteria bacterium HKST-UBA06]|nr:hypothetical protein [Cyanobacteria bacterium HKST-UBA06]
GAEALQAFAELNTGWSVSSSIGDGRATKEFSRVLAQADMTPQRRIGGELHRDTYLALADYENSHTELAQIFEAWGFAGDFVNGEYFVVRISAPAGPITYGDLNKILRAEALLAEQGYTGHGHLSRFDTGVPEPVTAKDSQI